MTDPHLIASVQQVQRDRRRCEMTTGEAEAWKAGARAMLQMIVDRAAASGGRYAIDLRDIEIPDPAPEPTGLEYRGG